MDESLHTNDDLLRYLDGEMNLQEQEAFEKQMEQDAALREAFERLEITRSAIRQYGVKEKVKGMHHQLIAEVNVQGSKPEGRVVPFRKVIRYSMAIAASLFLVFIGIQAYYFIRLSPANVFEEAFVDYNASNVRGENGGGNTIESAYAAKNYTAVATTPARDITSANDSLFVALAHLKLQRADEAIPFLKGLNRAGSPYKEDAEFYLGISYIKSRDYDKALDLLEPIENNKDHLYHNQVKPSLIRHIHMLKWK